MKDKILMAHGSGGKLAHELVEKVFVGALANPLLSRMDDSAVFPVEAGRMAFTTDSYVVSPLFFPGGDIGRLAVCGTVNDLATSGARPLYLSLAFIIEEGLPLSDLRRIVSSIANTAGLAGVQIVTGDTKVVDRGKADGLFINTAGVGVVPAGVNISGSLAQPRDKVVLSGTIGDHGIAVVSQREGLAFETTVESDCAPLASMVAVVLNACPDVHTLRDPTRGGLATTLNEIAGASNVGIKLFEERVPVKEQVQGACEMLGFDPLYVANEGKIIAIVPAADADAVVQAMRTSVFGKDATVIGEVTDSNPGRVVIRTILGSLRIVDMLSGDLLPRIC